VPPIAALDDRDLPPVTRRHVRPGSMVSMVQASPTLASVRQMPAMQKTPSPAFVNSQRSFPRPLPAIVEHRLAGRPGPAPAPLDEVAGAGFVARRPIGPGA